MKKGLLILCVVFILCSCEQMIIGNKVEVKKTMYTITHGEFECGTIEKSPSKEEYNRNEVVKITAVSDEGSEFIKWTGDIESSEKTISLTLNKNVVITPVFKKIQTFTISSSEFDGGRIKIEPSKEEYLENEKVHITAIPNKDWYFQGWRNMGFGVDDSIEIVMNKNYILDPIFTVIPKYSLRINEVEGGSVHVYPLKNAYDLNEVVTLTVLPNDGYRYKGIRGTILTSDLTKQILMDKNYELTPLFTMNPKYTLTFDGEYVNSIHVDPNKNEYDENERVIVTALPIDGYHFIRWEGTVLSNNEKLELVMNRDYIQKPVYKKNDTYSINIQNSGGGQVYISPQKDTYEKDELVVITAVANEECYFKGWFGSIVSSEKTINLVMNKNYTIESVFTPIIKYTLHIKEAAGGRVVCAPEKDWYAEKEEVTITAIANEGYLFSHWKGDITGTNNPYTVNMLRQYDIEAVFEPIPEIEKYCIDDIRIIGNGSVQIEPEKEYYLKNETITIRALPESGSMLSLMECSSQDYSWNKNSDEMTIQVRSNVELEVRFIKRQWSFLVYMAADNDLEYEAIIDFNELEGVNYAGKPVSIIVLLDRNPAYDSSNGNWSGTRLYEIQTDNAGVDGIIRSKELSCPELDLGSGYPINLNTASSDVLSKCIEYMQQTYKADNYGLIMWGHGTGWRSRGGEGANTKAFAIDDTSHSYMTNAAFGHAIENKGLKVIGFDTCYGGLLEIVYQIKDSAQCMIASEGSIPARGWDYYTLFSSFLETDLSLSSFSSKVVAQFKNQYLGEEKATISVIDLNKINTVKNKFDIFAHNAAALITTSEVRSTMLNLIMHQTLNFSQTTYPCNFYVDIYSLSEKMSASYGSLSASALSLQTALKSAVTQSWSSFGSDGYNLGIYFCDLIAYGVPASTHDSSYFKGSEAAQQTKFVQKNSGWVPTKNNEGSFLDKLFYTTF